MSELPHLRIPSNQTTEKYTYARGAPIDSAPFQMPPRNRPLQHAGMLRRDLQTAATEATTQRQASRQQFPDLVERQPEGLVLTFQSEPGFELLIERLEQLRSGIILLSLKKEGDVQTGKVFVPEGQVREFMKLIGAYANSVLMYFQAPNAKEEQLKALADPDDGVRVFGRTGRKNGMVTVPFLVEEGREAAFKAKAGSIGQLVRTGRKNDKLIASISSVRLAIVKDFWQDALPFPPDDQEIWWEIWLRGGRKTAQADHARFVELATIVGVPRVSPRYVAFPERVVVHAFASAAKLAASIDLVTTFAELRKGKELATHYVDLRAAEQAEFVEEAAGRLVLPVGNPPVVTIMDGGVHRNHPLLARALAPEDMHAVDPAWGVHDSFPHQHGTGMAGNALYGCLTEILTSNGPIRLQHRLESVKILPPPPAANSAPDFGRVTQEGVLQAHIPAADRNRVLCMAVTADDRDLGLPSLWSAAVDDLCAGVITGAKALMVISAGNVRDELRLPEYTYHRWNVEKANVDDPAQAWNALTVGAITEKVRMESPEWRGWSPIGEHGDLCPTSRTSLPWPPENQKGWPIKPDIVMEGGNYAEDPRGNRSNAEDLSLLTTMLHPSGRLFITAQDTSPATALAARYAAIIWSRYPRLWPETVRALMVHSASWNDAMRRRFPGESKTITQRRARCYGYGVPNLQKALHSATNAVALTFEGQLQPFQKKGPKPGTKEMHVHQLPWPVEVLQELGTTEVSMRVTLSYFVEPSPGCIGWGDERRYASHGLRFDVIRPTESLKGFKRRISRDFWDSPKERPKDKAAESRRWVIGDQARTKGSIHSDWWRGTAAELAASGAIAVYPVTGWWKERAHLERFNSVARYSMIVSLETPDTGIDLYTPIRGMVDVQTEILE